MFRSLCIFSLIAFSACAVNAQIPDGMMTFIEQAKTKAVQCSTSIISSTSEESIQSIEKFGETAKCVLNCFTTALGITNDDGSLNQSFVQMVPDSVPFKQTLETVVKDCANKPGNNPCEKNWNTLMCITHDQVMKSAVGKMVVKAQRFSKMLM